jgi:hypothetical protein
MLRGRSPRESWRQQKQAVEMTVYGKPGKRWNCFPPFPQTLEIGETDSHIPTATTTTTRMNISPNRPAKRYAFRGQGQ